MSERKIDQGRKVFRIGELAKRSGRSEHTIRWYETQRLIPNVRRDLQGRRTYVQGHIAWLDLLDRLRSTGMSIREMRDYTVLAKRGVSTLSERREIMRTHRARVEAKIREWRAALELLDAKVDFYGEWLTTGKQPPQPQRK